MNYNDTVYVFVLISCVISKCRSNFFMARKYDNFYDYKCITNSTFALGWITENLESNSNSEFIPQKSSNNFDCEIKSDDYSTKTYFLRHPWTLKSSLNEKNNDVILDRRWEGMKLYTSDYVEGYRKELKFQVVLSELENNFKIPLSIRIEREAHMFLCDGEDPGDSNCYWFLLQAWQGTATGLRKCGKGQIPIINNKWAEYPCDISLVKISHPEFPKYITKQKWNHFLLSKQMNHITFSQIGGSNKIIDYYDHNNGPVINVTHMIVHSKTVKGFWKIHEIEYIYTNEKTKPINMGPPIDASENFVCISMFVSMCSSCKLRLDLSVEYESTISQTKIYETTHSGWTEIKFIAENLPYNRKSLVISTEGISQDRFWAIDEVRLCQREEFRMISITGEKYNVPTCQLMQNENSIISFSKEPEDIGENYCPENTIGKYCVPCDWIFLKCDQVQICELDIMTEMCYCGAGYRKYSNCYYECDGGTYGHGCKKKCGKCKASWPFKNSYCSRANGTCSSGCSDDYRGPRCDIPPGLYFMKPPEILNITYTSVTIIVRDFVINEGTSTDRPSYYRAQYKKKDYSDSWTDVEGFHNFNENSVIKIDELEADTEYLVRCVIVTYYNKTYASETIPSRPFKTKCQDITENNIDVKPSNTSVEIILVNTNNLTCKNSKNRISIFNKRQSRLEENNSIVYYDLTPYTEYNIIIISTESGKSEKKFRTTEGVPAKVKNIKVINVTSSGMTLTWDKPEIYGKLEYYIVSYQFKARMGCNYTRNSPPKTMTVSDTSTTINDLVPYSMYLITVVAKNTKFKGKDSTIEESTLPLSTIQADEIPNIEEITPNFNSAAINLSPLECNKVFGPRFITVKITCTSEWCENKIQETKHRSISYILLKNLIPFSNYDVEIKFCRSQDELTCYKEKRYTTFKTKPSVPNEVRDLLVTSKSKNSVSLRWKPPYPPNGNLTQYRFSFLPIGYQSWKTTTLISSINASCRLWHEFHCFKIQNSFWENYEYIIKVEAKNEEPQNFGKPNTISTTIRTEQPEAPYGLEINWTVENDLLLKWKHPNQTNGDLQFFHIEITPGNEPRSKSVRKNISLTENDYNLTYPFEVKQNELSSSTRYKISIYADNGLKGKKLSIIDTSPPSIPSLDKEPFVSKTNETITVDITVKGLKPRDNCSLFLLVYNENYEKDELIELNNFKKKFSKVRIVYKELHLFKKSILFVIGNKSLNNPPLNPGTTYNVTFLLINEYENKTRYKMETFQYFTADGVSEPQDLSLLGLLILLILIPIIAVIFIKRRQLILQYESIKNNLLNRSTSNEILESPTEQIPLSNSGANKTHNEIQRREKKNDEPKKKIYSKPINIMEFEEYVKESILNGEFDRQHKLFPRGQTKPWTYGSMKANKIKNRYNNLLAYDHSRVILEKINGDQHSDYINANYIDGHKVPKAYIATQGPKASTVNDFWRMIWQENVKHIAMVANVVEGGKKKVEKYWPVMNEKLEFGEIVVQHISTEVFADYEHRIFKVIRNDEIREVDQLHFSSWPDHGVPLYSQSLVPFLQKILKLPLRSTSPIVVHCSAGVGRTGTILLCDISLRMAAREGYIDVLKNLQKLREQRANMVDNIEQYKLAHLVILECLSGMHTSIPCKDIEESVQKLFNNDGVQSQMHYLNDTQWQDQAMKTVGQTEDDDCVTVAEKNRFQDIIPEIQGRVFISRYPLDDDNSSYINAVKVDGFRCPGRFIVTQQPLPNTVADFWRLVDEHDVSVIISLNEINTKDKTSCIFWPDQNNATLTPVSYMKLKHVNTLSLECYNMVTIHMLLDSHKEHKTIHIISMNKWLSKNNCPETIEDFLTFWEESDALSRRSNPVIVTCYDGVTASGLYVAMSFVIEKMKLEQICDVCQAVRTVRHNRNQFVRHEEQFVFLYEAAVAYINGFQSYANFN